MLKLTISSTLLKTLSTSVGHIGTEVAILNKEHPFILAQEKESIEREAKMFKITVEEVIKRRAENEAKEPSKSFIDKLPLISNIKAYSDKVFKIDVDAANKEVTVQVNEEFVTEAIKIGTKVVINAMEPALNLAAVFANYAKEVDAFKGKWETETPTETVSTEVPAEKVPEEIRNKVEPKVDTSGWTFTLDEHPSKDLPFFTDEAKENYILCKDFICTRGKEVFNCSPSRAQQILNNTTKTVEKLAETYDMPSSLIRAIFAYYGVEAPAPKEEAKPADAVAEVQEQPKTDTPE